MQSVLSGTTDPGGALRLSTHAMELVLSTVYSEQAREAGHPADTASVRHEKKPSMLSASVALISSRSPSTSYAGTSPPHRSSASLHRPYTLVGCWVFRLITNTK